MSTETKKVKRAEFVTKLGVIAASVGSAVGLGNIWRFPYEAGTHGGGAFMLFYLLFIIVLGVPVMTAEFVMGRGARANIMGGWRKLASARVWHLTGYMGILASLMILSFYSVVAGWTLEYMVQSAAGALDLLSMDDYHARFDEFSTGNWRPLMWTLVFLIVNFVILARGVAKGIERVSNVLMPVLFVLLIVFCVNSLMMPGAAEGLTFLFAPDFSKISGSVILGALGQAFFSLSLGLGCMMTYGSYFNSGTRLVRSASVIAGLDTLVAVLAGVIIFPAVFTYGSSPAAGPTLVFEVLPNIFHQLPGGVIWSTLFFFLLFVASLTSTISMSEISIAFFTEEKGMSRRRATAVSAGVAMFFGALCALSFGVLGDITVGGLTIFGLFDYVTSNIMLPVGGLAVSLFAGWFIDRRMLRGQLTNNGSLRMPGLPVLMFCLRYICPLGIALVFLNVLGVI